MQERWIPVAKGSGDASGRPTVLRMIREDSPAQSSFALILIGSILITMISALTLSEQPARGFSTMGYFMLFLGTALVLPGVYLIRKRIREISHTYSTGQVVMARVTDTSISSTKSMTRTDIKVVYTFLGQQHKSRTSIPYAVLLSSGASVAIIVDPDDPDEFVLRDSYQTERGAIEASTDTCSVCREQISFLEVNRHMRTVHPKEYIAWRFWMAAVVLSIVLPIAAMLLSVPIFNDERVVVVVVAAIVALVTSTIAIDRLGKRWEAKVYRAWKTAHRDRHEKD